MNRRTAHFEKLFVTFVKRWDTCRQSEEERGAQPVRVISKKHSICTVKIVNTIPQLQQPVHIGSKCFIFEVDTGAGDNFCSMVRIGKPAFGKAHGHCEVANGQTLPTLGIFKTSVRELKIQVSVLWSS